MKLNRKDSIFPLSNVGLEEFLNHFNWTTREHNEHLLHVLPRSEVKKVSIIMYEILVKRSFEVGNWRYDINSYEITKFDKTKKIQRNRILKKFSKTKRL